MVTQKVQFFASKVDKVSVFLATILFTSELLFPHILFAQTVTGYVNGSREAEDMVFELLPDALASSDRVNTIVSNSFDPQAVIPGNPAVYRIAWSKYIQVTAYNSEIGQTDGSPFEAARGHIVRDGMVAANFLPIGSKVRLPDEFGDKIFTVLDRMNPRYSMRADIWMHSKTEAKQFGVRYLKLEVLASTAK